VDKCDVRRKARWRPSSAGMVWRVERCAVRRVLTNRWRPGPRDHGGRVLKTTRKGKSMEIKIGYKNGKRYYCGVIWGPGGKLAALRAARARMAA